jgi:hypothetical protein
VPYAATLGNHDAEGADTWRPDAWAVVAPRRCAWRPAALLRRAAARPGSAGTYFLPVRAGRREALRLHFVDSGARGCGPLPVGWGCVAAGALRWAAGQRGAGGAPAVAFAHIPSPEFLDAWRYALQPAARGGGGGRARFSGTAGEPVSCPLWPARRAAGAMRRDLNVTLLLSGHDHDNDFTARLPCGLQVAYGRKSGAGGYGRLPPGARILVLRAGGDPADAESYIRGADGSGPPPPGAPARPPVPRNARPPPQLLQRFCAASLGYEWDLLKLRRARRASAEPPPPTRAEGEL